MTFQDRIVHLIKSGFQAIFIPTSERSRCEAELVDVANKLSFKFITWDSVTGFSGSNGFGKDPLEALLSMDEEADKRWKGKNILFIMRNLHTYLDDTAVRQALQNLYYTRQLANDSHKRPLVLISNSTQLNMEIQPCLTMAEFTLPSEKELGVVFDEICQCITIEDPSQQVTIKYTDDLRNNVVQGMRGLSTHEAENILCYSLRVNRGFGPGLVDTIEDQKALTIEKSEILTYVPKDRIATMDEIGGYEELKEFIATRKLSYTRKARELKLDLPKGIVLVGVPGVGKSVMGKVIARELSLPLVILNVSAIFGSLVGESERRIRTALATVDALDGAVMLVDEAEKALGGASEAQGDSGVSRRVFGVLLTWLTEKTSRTFVVMTMNRTRGIPAEFLRRGRFDEVFCADVPNEFERDQILKIHCRKRYITIEEYAVDEWKELIKKTTDCVGAELEQLVCDARFVSFAARESGQPTIKELMDAIPKAPIAVAERESIEEIRKACEGRARPVSKQRTNVTQSGNRTVTIN
jgi:ATP-dependent 26S proteasome regulatory subunit